MIEVARTDLGRITLEPKALNHLVRGAVEGAGEAKVGALDISLEDAGAATVSVTITAPRRAVLHELGMLIQRRVADALQQALATAPASVDVTIDGIHLGEGD